MPGGGASGGTLRRLCVHLNREILGTDVIGKQCRNIGVAKAGEAQSLHGVGCVVTRLIDTKKLKCSLPCEYLLLFFLSYFFGGAISSSLVTLAIPAMTMAFFLPISSFSASVTHGAA